MNIIHSETITNYEDGLSFFIENKEHIDAITYNSVRHFLINNISILELDEYGNIFYEFSIDRNSDIIDNIYLECPEHVKAQIVYYINGKKFLPEEVKSFIICAAVYNDFKIRVTFLEKPNFNDEFKIIMRNYLLNVVDKKILSTNTLGVKCDNIIYHNGVCYKQLL